MRRRSECGTGWIDENRHSRDIFEDTWIRPLSRIAMEFGVSDTARRKMCHRHDIPTPGRRRIAVPRYAWHVRTGTRAARRSRQRIRSEPRL